MRTLLITWLVLLAVVGWSYWPAFGEMFHAWESNADYSHGYLVAPIAAFFLWARRGALATEKISPNLIGLGVLAGVIVLRAAAGMYFLGPLDTWTFPICLAGMVLLLHGGHCLLWSLPSIAFLYFMIPIPYSMETMLSVPLQKVATRLSTEALVLLGQPAIAEGNVIWVAETPLEIAEACSGLRILVGISALAFAFVLFSSWSLWQKGLVVAAIAPVALFANSARIVTTGLLNRYVSGEVAHRFNHDLAGFAMIPFAALILWMFLLYLDRLFPVIRTDSPMAPMQMNRPWK